MRMVRNQAEEQKLDAFPMFIQHFCYSIVMESDSIRRLVQR
jgi:hypothetical protein